MPVDRLALWACSLGGDTSEGGKPRKHIVGRKWFPEEKQVCTGAPCQSLTGHPQYMKGQASLPWEHRPIILQITST